MRLSVRCTWNSLTQRLVEFKIEWIILDTQFSLKLFNYLCLIFFIEVFVHIYCQENIKDISPKSLYSWCPENVSIDSLKMWMYVGIKVSIFSSRVKQIAKDSSNIFLKNVMALSHELTQFITIQNCFLFKTVPDPTQIKFGLRERACMIMTLNIHISVYFSQSQRHWLWSSLPNLSICIKEKSKYLEDEKEQEQRERNNQSTNSKSIFLLRIYLNILF